MIEKMMDENNNEEDRPQDKIYSKNIMSEMISTLSHKMENNNFKPFPFEQLKQKKEPEKTAVAIAYEPGEKAPKILATGKGQVAEKIIEKAKESQVPTYKDNKLASTLSKLQIGDMIPPELYEVVAEIVVFVDDMDRMKAKIDQAGVK